MTTSRRVDVYFHKRGKIDIMANTAKILGLSRGDVIDVYFDTSTRELYLYVKNKADLKKVTGARYRNIAVPTNKTTSSNMRVQSVDITNFINRLTNSAESWLFVGELTTIHKLGVTGLPLIYMNNQYKNNYEQSVQTIIHNEGETMVL